jgi:hypothetical protein
MDPRPPAFVSRALLAGCLAGAIACHPPGELQWDGGRAPLRTAFWQARDDAPDGGHISVGLSTSEFPCAPDLVSDDPAELTLNQLELQTGACREGARHLVVELWRTTGGVAGDYTGLEADDGVTERFATGHWFAIEEAGVLYIDGINRSYAPVDGASELSLRAGTGGEVAIDSADERVTGELWFPEVGVAAEFDAVECPAGPNLTDDLFDSALLAYLQVGC